MQDQYQRSQAAQQESEAHLAAVRAKLKAADELAAAQSSLKTQLQEKLATAESGLKSTTGRLQQLQTTHQALLDETKRQREAWGEQQATRGHTEREVRVNQWYSCTTAAPDLATYPCMLTDSTAVAACDFELGKTAVATRVCLLLQIEELRSQLAAACSRAETAERQQQATATASTLALSRAQQELDEARSAQFVAEEAHKTADAAAKLLAQKITGKLPDSPQPWVLSLLAALKQVSCSQMKKWLGFTQARYNPSSKMCHTLVVLSMHPQGTLLNYAHAVFCAEVQRDAAQQQGIADAGKQELCSQVAGLMRELELQRQQAQVRSACLLTRRAGSIVHPPVKVNSPNSCGMPQTVVHAADAQHKWVGCDTYRRRCS